MPDTTPHDAAEKATFRDRIRRAICEAEGFDWDPDMLEPDEYGDHADAVLAVLRAATLRELEQLHRPNTPPSRPEPRRVTATEDAS